MNSEDATLELREPPWLGLGLLAAGVLLLLTLLMFALPLMIKPERPPIVWVPWAALGVTVVLLAIGYHFFRSSRVALRMQPTGLELPAFNAKIPWTGMAGIDVMLAAHVPGATSPLLLITLTPEARRQLANRLISDFQGVEKFDPRPDVCVKLNLWNLGPGVETFPQFADSLRKRQAAAKGETVQTQTDLLPALEAPLTLRDMSRTGAAARPYIHDACGTATMVTGSSLYWVTNPLRYMSGSICAQCGEAMDASLQWEDTGETVSRFRSRMWRHTPLITKLLHFLILPALCSAGAYFAMPLLPRAPNIDAQTSQWIAIGVGYLGGLMLLWITPLAALAPALTGMAYHKYR